MAGEKDMVLGIDLGTTYSCAAYMHNNRPRIIPSEKGYATVPSVVGLSRKGEIVVGHPALDQIISKPEDTIYGAKRLIGRKFNSMIVQKIASFMTYPIVEGPHSEAAVYLGDKIYGLSEISAYILREIRDMAQRQLEREITRAVITVPAYYSDNQRQAVKEAGTLAGFKVERIINEPTAAAVAYGFNKGLDQKVLVYDLGGGTFDVSVLHIHGNKFDVLATGGDTFLGGVDFDNRVTDFVLQKFQEASGKDIRNEKVSMQRLRAASERAKRDLSQERATKVQLPYITEIDGEPVDLHVEMNRDQLNKLTVDLVDRTFAMCDQVLASVNIDPKKLDEILLVGGQTRMPLVQDKIRQHFGKPPRKGVHPDEVVALGATLLGSIATSTAGVKLKDVLSIPIGIALPNGKFKTVLNRNTPIPASRSYKVSIPRKKGLEIDVYQGDQELVLENEYLGTFQFPAESKPQSAEAKVEMRFDLTEECLLSVNIRDLESGETNSEQMITLQTPKSLQAGLQAALEREKKQRTEGTGEKGWLSSFAKRVLTPK